MRSLLFRNLLKKGKLGKVLILAPVALEVANMLHQSQKKKRSKYVKARKRDQAVDFALDQANRLFGKKKPAAKRRWF